MHQGFDISRRTWSRRSATTPGLVEQRKLLGVEVQLAQRSPRVLLSGWQVSLGQHAAAVGRSARVTMTFAGLSHGRAPTMLLRVPLYRLTRARGGRLQKLYQDPTLSFPRRVPLERALRDVMHRYGVEEGRVRSLLTEVGLPFRDPAPATGPSLGR